MLTQPPKLVRKARQPTLEKCRKASRLVSTRANFYDGAYIDCMHVRLSILAIDQDTHSSNDTHGDPPKYAVDPSHFFCDLKYYHVERRYATFKLFYTDKTPADYDLNIFDQVK